MQRNTQLEEKLKILFYRDYQVLEPYVNNKNNRRIMGNYAASIFCGGDEGANHVLPIINEINKDDDILTDKYQTSVNYQIIIKSQETLDLVKKKVEEKLSIKAKKEKSINNHYFWEVNRNAREKTHPDLTPDKISRVFDIDPQLIKNIKLVDNLFPSIEIWCKEGASDMIATKIRSKLETDNHKKYNVGSISSSSLVSLQYDGRKDFLKAVSIPESTIDDFYIKSHAI